MNLDDKLMLAVAQAIIDPPPTSLEVLGLASLPREQALELATRAGQAHDAELAKRGDTNEHFLDSALYAASASLPGVTVEEYSTGLERAAKLARRAGLSLKGLLRS